VSYIITDRNLVRIIIKTQRGLDTEKAAEKTHATNKGRIRRLERRYVSPAEISQKKGKSAEPASEHFRYKTSFPDAKMGKQDKDIKPLFANPTPGYDQHRRRLTTFPLLRWLEILSFTIIA